MMNIEPGNEDEYYHLEDDDWQQAQETLDEWRYWLGDVFKFKLWKKTDGE